MGSSPNRTMPFGGGAEMESEAARIERERLIAADHSNEAKF
jgi:hypothetical protein